MSRDFSCRHLNGCSTLSRFFCRDAAKNDFVNSIWKTTSSLIVNLLPCASSRKRRALDSRQILQLIVPSMLRA